MRFKQITIPQQCQSIDFQSKDSNESWTVREAKISEAEPFTMPTMSTGYCGLPAMRVRHVLGASRFWFRRPSGIPLPPGRRESNRRHIQLLRRPRSNIGCSWVYPSPVMAHTCRPGYMASTVASRNKSRIHTKHGSRQPAVQHRRADIPQFQHPWVPSKQSRLLPITEPKRLPPFGGNVFAPPRGPRGGNKSKMYCTDLEDPKTVLHFKFRGWDIDYS
jgi:hypothetical protein